MSQQINDKIYTPHQPSDADYEKAEMDLIYDALNRSYTERFLMATRLYKIGQTLNKAKIIRKPYTLNK